MGNFGKWLENKNPTLNEELGTPTPMTSAPIAAEEEDPDHDPVVADANGKPTPLSTSILMKLNKLVDIMNKSKLGRRKRDEIFKQILGAMKTAGMTQAQGRSGLKSGLS